MNGKQLLWLVIGSLTLVGVIFLTWYYQTYVGAMRTAEEFTVMNNTVNVGEVRKNYEDGNTFELFDKEELAARALLEVSSNQKDHDLDMEVSYAFLDKDNNVTEDEKLIRSIQLKVSYKKLGKSISTTTHRYGIDELME